MTPGQVLQAKLAAQLQTSKVTDFPTSNWEDFHATHSSAKFFKPRRYICLAFPALLQPGVHILEIGCGCGASIIPTLKVRHKQETRFCPFHCMQVPCLHPCVPFPIHVAPIVSLAHNLKQLANERLVTSACLQANPSCTATVCDVSPTAIANLKSILQSEGIDQQRVHASVLDAASAAGSSPICQTPANICMIVFTLSAVPPDEMHLMLERAFESLSPGGLLLIRDYGWLDMVSTRFPPEQRIDQGLYYRCPITCALLNEMGSLPPFFTCGQAMLLMQVGR